MPVKDFHLFCTGLPPETVTKKKAKKQVGFSTHVPLWKKKNITRAESRRLMRIGIIKRANCIICGSNTAEIHHKNYESATDIVWLCKQHHVEEHKKLRKEKIVI